MADTVDRVTESAEQRFEETLQDALLPIEAVADPLSRYKQAARAEALLLHAADWLTDLRASSTLELHDDGASYATIAKKIGLSRARAQQLVNRGRDVEARTTGLLRKHKELLSAGRNLRESMRLHLDEGRRIREGIEEVRRLRARNRRAR